MGRKKKLLIGVGIGAGFLVLYGPGWIRWAQLRGREEQFKQEIQQLARENHQLYQESRRLREDPSYAEAVARRQLGLVRPGETKVKFQQTEESTRR